MENLSANVQNNVSGIKKFLEYAINNKASDIHLNVGVPPIIRIDGKLRPIEGEQAVTEEQNENYICNLLNKDQIDRLKKEKEIDFSFSYDGHRMRANVYYEKNAVSASLRLINSKVKTFDELGLPPILEKFTLASQGLVIVTGPTGHGKSTTLAAMIDYINKNRNAHVLTIEDPIEYIFPHNRSMMTQREVGSDTHSFADALRASFREDPDVIMVGEMRDHEAIEAALTLAETGHLVLTTLHTNSASQTANRIVDAFPPHQQDQIRAQLADVLVGVVSQRLVPKISGGRLVACEIMISNNAIKSLIRDGKTHQIDNIIKTSALEGMVGLDKVLGEYVNKGEITLEDALTWALDPKTLKMMVY